MTHFLDQFILYESVNSTETAWFGTLRSIPQKSEKVQIIAMLIPVFLVCILGEAWVAKFHKNSELRYSFADSATSITAGVIQSMIVKVIRSAAPVLPYAYLFEHWRLIERVPLLDTWLMGGVLFAAIDMMYYWGHRLSHSSTFVWSGHHVHHSSEYYNFTTALRQGFFEGALTWPRSLVFAVIGFPPAYFMLWNELNFGLMFFSHTESVGKLWWPIELIFNTPSHHRVHHGRNPEYIDKNYAGIFIVWDRLFGTFEEERAKPVYGLVHPLHTYDPMTVQLRHMRNVLADAFAARSPLLALRTMAYGPGWYWDDGAQQWREHPLPSVEHVRDKEYRAHAANTPLMCYTFAQFALFLLAALFATDEWHWQSGWDYALAFALVVHSATVIAGLNSTHDNFDAEKKRASVRVWPGARYIWRCGDADVNAWARRAETARFAVLLFVALVHPAVTPRVRIGTSAAALVSLLWLHSIDCTRAAAKIVKRE